MNRAWGIALRCALVLAMITLPESTPAYQSMDSEELLEIRAETIKSLARKYKIALARETVAGIAIAVSGESVESSDPEELSDPDAELLERLDSLPKPVICQSACSPDMSRPPGCLIETASGKQVVRFHVGKITRKGPNRVLVQASYFLDGRAGAGYECTLVYQRGAWTVASRRLLWIS
jgi:hypothetical protein